MDKDELMKFMIWLKDYPYSYLPSDYHLVVEDYLSGKPYNELESFTARL